VIVVVMMMVMMMMIMVIMVVLKTVAVECCGGGCGGGGVGGSVLFVYVNLIVLSGLFSLLCEARRRETQRPGLLSKPNANVRILILSRLGDVCFLADKLKQ
jgi:hypothetical protein